MLYGLVGSGLVVVVGGGGGGGETSLRVVGNTVLTEAAFEKGGIRGGRDV